MTTHQPRQKWSYQQITDVTEAAIKRHLESATKCDQYGAGLYKNWATGALFAWSDLVGLKIRTAPDSKLYDRFSIDRARFEDLIDQMSPSSALEPAKR